MAASSSSSSASQPLLLYACIAHDDTILAEHTVSSPQSAQASSLANLVIPKINHSSSEKKTYTHGTLCVHYISLSADDHPAPSSAGGLTFLCVAREELGRRVPFAFLVDAQTSFLDTYPAASTGFADLPAYGCAAYNSTLKAKMARMAQPEGQQDAIRNARREIDDARAIMSENIERVLERGERIDLLVDKTDRLGGNATDFRVRSTGLRRRMWWKNVKLMVLLVLVVIFLVYLFVSLGCGFPAWGRCIG